MKTVVKEGHRSRVKKVISRYRAYIPGKETEHRKPLRKRLHKQLRRFLKFQ